MALRLLISVMIFFGVNGCGSRVLSISAEEAFPRNFTDIRTRIIGPRCGTCHSAFLSYNSLLSLTSSSGGRRGGQVVTAPRPMISVGSPESSQLFLEIDDGVMPPSQKMPQVEIDAVSDWISSGAKND